MPFASKAQQRFMYAAHPEKAKEWAKETPNMKDLPEKLHPSVNPKGHKIHGKIASDGMFFQKRAQSSKGRFFRDMAGRDDGLFHEKAAVDDMGDAADGGAGATAAPMGGMDSAGDDAGGGMYGTGKPKKKPVIGKGAAKTAARSPNDWDDSTGIPTGFHRPAIEQPKDLEAGGERFHSTEAKAPDFGAANEQRHGVVEGGSMHTRPTTGHQMGKHASPRFLGTSFQKSAFTSSADDYVNRGKSYASGIANQAGNSLETAGKDAVGALDRGVKGVASSPLAMTIAAGLGIKALGHGAGAAGRGAKRLLGIKKKVNPGILERAVGGLRRLATAER